MQLSTIGPLGVVVILVVVCNIQGHLVGIVRVSVLLFVVVPLLFVLSSLVSRMLPSMLVVSSLFVQTVSQGRFVVQVLLDQQILLRQVGFLVYEVCVL